MYYRRAMLMNPAKSLWLQRKIIDLQLATDDAAGAAASLEEYLGHPELKDSEKSWAMGEQAHLMADRGEFATAPADARRGAAAGGRSGGSWAAHLLAGVLPVQAWPDGRRRGGTCGWRGNCLKIQHPLDADAAYLLGKIAAGQQAAGRGEFVLRGGADESPRCEGGGGWRGWGGACAGSCRGRTTRG